MVSCPCNFLLPLLFIIVKIIYIPAAGHTTVRTQIIIFLLFLFCLRMREYYNYRNILVNFLGVYQTWNLKHTWWREYDFEPSNDDGVMPISRAIPWYTSMLKSHENSLARMIEISIDVNYIIESLKYNWVVAEAQQIF